MGIAITFLVVSIICFTSSCIFETLANRAARRLTLCNAESVEPDARLELLYADMVAYSRWSMGAAGVSFLVAFYFALSVQICNLLRFLSASILT